MAMISALKTYLSSGTNSLKRVCQKFFIFLFLPTFMVLPRFILFYFFLYIYLLPLFSLYAWVELEEHPGH